MKKLLSLILTLSIVLAFTACDTTGEPDDETTAADEAVTEEEATTTEETTSPPTTTAPDPLLFIHRVEYMYEVEDEVIFLVFIASPHNYAFHRNGIVTYIHNDDATWRDDNGYSLIYYYPFGYDEAGTYWVEGYDTLHVNISGQTYKWKLLRNENIQTTGTTIGELIYYGMHILEDGSWLHGRPGGVNDEYGDINQPDEPATVNVGDIIQLGGYDWRVLDVQDGRAFIITDRIIDNRAYHNEFIY
ncbi:MAG: hypothetical protein FWD34_08100, partial [Oscillospiraceae bacterium]|nr:hypothetical protein [Oscillospiraceae bacterium]